MDMAPKAALWAMQAVYPGMRARGWGRIINMCSLNGVNAHPYTGDYNMGKEALRTLTRSAAREWAPYGICCNAMCPGAATEAEQLLDALPEAQRLRLPMRPGNRSLNLSNAVAVLVFEAWRQHGFAGGA